MESLRIPTHMRKVGFCFNRPLSNSFTPQIQPNPCSFPSSLEFPLFVTNTYP